MLTAQSLRVWGPMGSPANLQDISQGPGVWHLALLHGFSIIMLSAVTILLIYSTVFSIYFILLLSGPETCMQYLFQNHIYQELMRSF